MFIISAYLTVFLTLVLGAFLLIMKQKTRKKFYFYFVISFCIGFVCCWFFPSFENFWGGPYLGYLVSFSAMLLVVYATFDIGIKRTVFYGIAVYAIQNIAYHLQYIFTNDILNYKIGFWFGILVNIALTACFCVLINVFILRKFVNGDEFIIGNGKLTISAGGVLLITFILSSILAIYQPERIVDLVSRLFAILCCVFSLLLQLDFFTRSNLQRRNDIIEQLLYMEREHHRISKENIDFINIKCHDLKYQISKLRAIVNQQEQEKYLQEIEKSTAIYDAIVKTGNDSLDIILMEKCLICEKYHIKFSYIVDGEKLNFIDAVDIYTLFGNLLDNAIESVVKTDDEDQRIISLYVTTVKDKILTIHMENYCNQNLVFENGLPITTKKDKKYHGYGMRSLQLIAEKYTGALNSVLSENIFTLDIVLPLNT